MELPKDYNDVQGITGDYEALEPGGYICKIISAKEEKSKNDNRMLVIAFDIAEGEHAGIYQRKFDEAKKQNTDPNKQVKWNNNGIHRIMILDKEGKTNKFFKGFGTIIEESNTNYKFTGDESSLKDKIFGAVFGEEEYEKMDGSIGTVCKINQLRTVKAIKEEKYKIPEIKKLNKGEAYEFDTTSSGNDDLPF